VRRLLPATLLVSAGAIGYELVLMRLLSIVQWHHFAYMIISLALLGYGASGTFIALFRQRLERRFEAAFATSALLFSITMVGCFALGQRVPFNALEVVWDPRQFLNLSLIYLVFFVPFFFAASCIGLAFTCRGRDIGRIYFFDLLGAGSGAVLVIGLLFLLVPQRALLVLTALPLIASVLMNVDRAARWPLAGSQLAWLALVASGVSQPWLEFRISEYKGLSQALAVVDSRVDYEASSPLGYITVVASPTIPIRHAPGLSFATRHIPPEQLGVFSDADGMSAITRFDGDFEKLAFLGDTTAALPYALLDEPDVLVLGAGTGSDVLLALYHGAASVDAVELDPQMSALVTETYADFAGDVYGGPRVTLHTREARGYVAQSGRRYDLIHIGLLDSFGASGAGVQSLNESYIYTVEALREYLEHTAPGGIVAITRWLKLPPRDSLKLIATAIEALRQTGAGEPGARLAVIRGWNTSTLLVRNGAFGDADVAAIRRFAATRSFDTAWFPGIEAGETNRYNLLDEPYLYNGTAALLGDAAAGYARRYKFHIEPAIDDRPYFFHFFRWATLPEIYALRKVGGAGLIEWGYLILVATLLQALVAGLVLILVPLSRVRRDWPPGTGPRMGAYFLLLGFAFLFVEMAFIQKFILFLSHPLYSVAVVLAGFLVFAGIGSAASRAIARRVGAAGRSPITAAVTAIAIIALAYVFLLPVLFDRLIGQPDAFRIAFSITLIAPLAFVMGLPFPLGLGMVSESAPGFVPWAWGINGFASVLSAVLATLLAIALGFTAVIVLAIGLYALAALLISRSASPARR
jgi:hypothetical protein